MCRPAPCRTFWAGLDTYLSGTQLGVTLASLALGAIGEPAVAGIFCAWLLSRQSALHRSRRRLDVVAIGLGFVLITFFHITFGELLPKWWVIAHTEKNGAWRFPAR